MQKLYLQEFIPSTTFSASKVILTTKIYSKFPELIKEIKNLSQSINRLNKDQMDREGLADMNYDQNLMGEESFDHRINRIHYNEYVKPLIKKYRFEIKKLRAKIRDNSGESYLSFWHKDIPKSYKKYGSCWEDMHITNVKFNNGLILVFKKISQKKSLFFYKTDEREVVCIDREIEDDDYKNIDFLDFLEIVKKHINKKKMTDYEANVLLCHEEWIPKIEESLKRYKKYCASVIRKANNFKKNIKTKKYKGVTINIEDCKKGVDGFKSRYFRHRRDVIYKQKFLKKGIKFVEGSDPINGKINSYLYFTIKNKLESEIEDVKTNKDNPLYNAYKALNKIYGLKKLSRDDIICTDKEYKKAKGYFMTEDFAVTHYILNGTFKSSEEDFCSREKRDFNDLQHQYRLTIPEDRTLLYNFSLTKIHMQVNYNLLKRGSKFHCVLTNLPVIKNKKVKKNSFFAIPHIVNNKIQIVS